MLSLANKVGACARSDEAETELPLRVLEIVHRDVSPGNILLTYDGVTKVVDFGVAAGAHKRHRTQTRAVRGRDRSDGCTMFRAPP